MTFMDYSRQFTTQGFSKVLDSLEQKGKLSVTTASNISSALFRARMSNNIVYGINTESFYKTMLLQCLLYLDQQRWYLVKKRTNLSLSAPELLDALETLDLQMRNGVTTEVAKILATLYIVVDVLYCFYCKKRVEMRAIMNQHIDGPGTTMRATIERAQAVLAELRKFAGNEKANRDVAVAAFLNVMPASRGTTGKVAF